MNSLKSLNNSGLTVIETMVAIVVLTTSALSIAMIFNDINSLQIDSDRYAEATSLAEQKIEDLRNSHYNELETTNPPDTSSSEDPIDFSDELTNFPEGQGEIRISEPAANLRRVDVTISYDSAGQTETVQLSSIIGALGIAQ